VKGISTALSHAAIGITRSDLNHSPGADNAPERRGPFAMVSCFYFEANQAKALSPLSFLASQMSLTGDFRIEDLWTAWLKTHQIHR
jgi:hypothetical protein